MAERTEREELLSFISDAHKDAYGYRPYDFSCYSNLSVERLRKEVDKLSSIVEENINREAAEKAANAVAFEARVAEVIATGAGTRATALRWIFEAEGITESVDMYRGSYASYHFGLEYRYFAADYPEYQAA